MAHHKDLTGTDLHEPKGVAAASAGTVYVANGSGSGAWTAQKGSVYALTRTFDDVSTAADMYVAIPKNGTIARIEAVLDAAITLANSAVTFSIGGVAVDSSALTIAFSGSAPGTEFNSTPSGHNTVVAGNVLKISTDGASSTVAKLSVTVLINVS
jgi:hypothetical protein